MRIEPAPGVVHLPGHLDDAEQHRLLKLLRDLLPAGAFTRPTMPRSGRPFSVLQASLGEYGWVSDARGYRYEQVNPATGQPWAPIPPALLAIWQAVAGVAFPPDSCLVNLYRDGARMGLHRDADEAEPAAPVVSVSLGDTAVFRIGGDARTDSTRSFRLASGDVVVFGGPARFMFHGIDRVIAGSSDLVAGGGRINLTFRRVAPAT